MCCVKLVAALAPKTPYGLLRVLSVFSGWTSNRTVYLLQNRTFLFVANRLALSTGSMDEKFY